MQLELEGKVAVVTGASRGIGLAAARVVAGARSNSTDLDALVESAPVEFVPVDLSTRSGPADLAAVALAHGPVDVLINNVGAAKTRLGGFLSITDDDWTTSLTLNLMAA